MKLAVILFLLLLTSCGQQTPQSSTDQPSKPVFQQVQTPHKAGPTKCIDGASYEMLYGGAFLKFDKDGKYIPC